MAGVFYGIVKIVTPLATPRAAAGQSRPALRRNGGSAHTGCALVARPSQTRKASRGDLD